MGYPTMGDQMKDQFTFAGFTFPRHVAMLERGSIQKRIERRRKSPCTSGYYITAPTPITGGTHPGEFFYLDSDFMPGLRWYWADEIDGARINHTGWYTDDDAVGDLMRGIVLRLPHGRGFLAGWSLGKGMASSIEGDLYTDIIEAARAADSTAQHAAENEREYQTKERERLAAEEREQELAEERENERLEPLRDCLIGKGAY
jgi:hypothetical protein